MIIEKDLKKLFHQLDHDDIAHISLGSSDVTVRVFDGASRITLSTPVYHGGNFLPKSVRHCTSQKLTLLNPIQIKTSLRIDEENFRVILNYLGDLGGLTTIQFKDILEEFSYLAEEWRLHLDENDKNDLVHVRVQ